MLKYYHAPRDFVKRSTIIGYARRVPSPEITQESVQEATEDTRWLTADEQLAWRTFLTACQTLFSTIDAQLLRDSDIPHGYYEILVRLSETPGRALRMTQLAEASTSSKSRCRTPWPGWKSGAGSAGPTAPRTGGVRSRSSPTRVSPRWPPRRQGTSRRSGGP